MTGSSEAQASVAAITKALSEFSLDVDMSAVKYHDAVMTSEAQVEALGGAASIEGVLLKNLVLKDKKKRIYILSVEHDREVDLKKLAKLIVRAS